MLAIRDQAKLLIDVRKQVVAARTEHYKVQRLRVGGITFLAVSAEALVAATSSGHTIEWNAAR